jgi:serine/threonine protein kinase
MAPPADKSPPPDGQTTKAQRRIGRYIVLEVIKIGGQGIVYRALDPAIGRELAIKELILADLEPHEISEARERFRREAHAVGKLRHANIVILHDFIEEPALYLVMEFVSGSLHELLGRKTRLTTPEALEIVRQVASALDEAHANGIIHRDIKPGNILLDDDRQGGRPLAKVADFGIARIISETMTKTGLVMGTLKYMAPEQVNGLKVDARADQFSLAVVAFELLGRKLPFTGPTVQSLMYQILHEEPASLLDANPELPPDAERVIRRALAKNPAERFDSCGLFARALEEAISLSETATRITVDPKSSTGKRIPAVIAALLVVLALALSFGWHIFDRHPETTDRKVNATGPDPTHVETPEIPKSVPLVSAPPVEAPETHSPPNEPENKKAVARNRKIDNLRASIPLSIQSKQWREAQLRIADLLRLVPGDKQASAWKTEVSSLRAQEAKNATPSAPSRTGPVQSARAAPARGQLATSQPLETPKAPGRGATIAVTTPPKSAKAEPPSPGAQVTDHINRAQAMQASGNYAGAIDEFKAARVLDPTNRVATDGISAATQARDSAAHAQTVAPPAADADLAPFTAVKNSSDPERLEAVAATLTRADLATILRDRAKEIRAASAPPAVVTRASAADIKILRAEFGKQAIRARELNERLNAADQALRGAGGVPPDLRAAWNGMIHEMDLAADALDKADAASYHAAARRADGHMATIERSLVKQ